MNRDRLLELLDDYVECALTEADQDELEKLLLEAEEARRLFWAYLQQQTLLQKLQFEADGQALAKVESCAITTAPPKRANILPDQLARAEPPPRRKPVWAVWAVLAASVAAVLLLALYLWDHRAEAPGPLLVTDSEVLLTPRRLGEADDDSPALLATWLGGPKADFVGGIAIAPDGSILVGGTLPAVDLTSWNAAHLMGEGDGIVLRISPDGKRPLAVLRRDGSVDDLRVDAAGHLYLIGSHGYAKLDPSLRTEWALDAKTRNGRITPGPAGGAVTLSGDQISVLDRHGKVQNAWSIADRLVHDIICDPVHRVIYATGSSKPGIKEGEIPFVYAFDLTGKTLWKAYDWTRDQVDGQKLRAGSVGLRLALGKDGQLYVAGESHGGNTVWGRQSIDLGASLPGSTDRFHNPYNIGNQFLTFVGSLDPRTGKVFQSKMLLGRADRDRGSSMRPAALAVDGDGRIYVGGWAGATPPVSPGAFGLRGEGEGAFLCVLDRDFKRIYAARLCGGTTTAIVPGDQCDRGCRQGQGWAQHGRSLPGRTVRRRGWLADPVSQGTRERIPVTHFGTAPPVSVIGQISWPITSLRPTGRPP